MAFQGLSPDSPGHTKVYKDLPGLTKFLRASHGFTIAQKKINREQNFTFNLDRDRDRSYYTH